MSPETFTGHVREYCDWAESDTHDIGCVHQLLLTLMQGAPGLDVSRVFPPERGYPGLPQEVLWAETNRFADLPFQCYPPVFWPYEAHAEGPFTDDIWVDFGHTYGDYTR